MHQSHEDFMLYVRHVLEFLKARPSRYPAFNHLMDMRNDEVETSFVIMGVEVICLFNFKKNRAIWVAANMLEECVVQGTQEALLMMETDTVH